MLGMATGPTGDGIIQCVGHKASQRNSPPIRRLTRVPSRVTNIADIHKENEGICLSVSRVAGCAPTHAP